MSTLELAWLAAFLTATLAPVAALFREWLSAQQRQEWALRSLVNQQVELSERTSSLLRARWDRQLSDRHPELLNKKGQVLLPSHYDRSAVGAGRAWTEKINRRRVEAR